MACRGTYCGGHCYTYGCGQNYHSAVCSSNGKGTDYDNVSSGLKKDNEITKTFINSLRKLIDHECNRRHIATTGLGNLAKGDVIKSTYCITLQNKINSFYGTVNVVYNSNNEIDPTDFSGLRSKIFAALYDCVCNSDCGANARCSCHNNCGCHY